MSQIERFVWVRMVRLDRELLASAKVVAQVIAESFNGKSAFPGQEFIAEKAGLSVPTVKRAVKALQNRQWLTARRRGFAQGNSYHLRIPPALRITNDPNGTHHTSLGITDDPSFGSQEIRDQYTYQTPYQEEEECSLHRGSSPTSDAIRATCERNEGSHDQEPGGWEIDL